MKETVEQILMIPRFTTFTLGGPWYTAPTNIRKFGSGGITVWGGPGLGSSPVTACQVTPEQSVDLENWFALDYIAPGSAAEVTQSYSFTMEWLRLKVLVTGGAWQGLTVWSVGNFVVREL